ncbi:MAG TPA: hypothetical protein PKL13_00990 [bacterium]|nr:hypothetical protein [bacterium]
MKIYALFVSIVVLFVFFVSGCYMETTAYGKTTRTSLISNPSTGQFNSATGRRVWSEKLIYAAFINNSSNSFTIKIVNVRRGTCFLDDIIYPGNYVIELIPSGEYSVYIKRGVDYTYDNNIIVWREGSFDVNGKKVDIKIDLENLWRQCGGGSEFGGYKF